MQGIAMETKKESGSVFFCFTLSSISLRYPITAMPTFRHFGMSPAVPVGKMKRRFSEAKRRNGVSSFAVSGFSLFSADFFSLLKREKRPSWLKTGGRFAGWMLRTAEQKSGQPAGCLYGKDEKRAADGRPYR